MIPGRNDFERSITRQLRRAKVEFKYEVHRLPYTIQGTYIPDFTVWNNTGSFWYCECKGYFRVADKRKLVAVKRCNPDADIRIVFYAYRERDIKWANRQGFPYAIGRIPDEWLHSSSTILPMKLEITKENGIGAFHAMEKFKIGDGLEPSTISPTNG